MRGFQNTLLLIGCPVLFAVSCAVGAGFAGALIFQAPAGEHGTGAWGSYYGAMLCFVLGGLFGALVGLSIAVASIARSDGNLWKVPTWGGIGGGIVLGLLVRFVLSVSEVNGMFGELILRYWFAAGILIICTGTLGGFAGALVERIWLRRAAPRKHSLRH
ncbi:MAG: hypothetical protein U0903_14570 [Planctomycetales bacterium]